MIVISVTGLKGGVGKTSTAVNLATAAGLRGWRTLVWDLDAQGAAAHCLGTSTASTASEPRAVIDDVAKNVSMLLDRSRPTRAPGVSVVAGDASLRLFDRRTKGRRGQRRMRKQIEAAARSVDLLIIDSPPGLGLTLERLIDVSDLILLPTEPAPLSVRALDEIRGFIAAQGPVPTIAVLSMVDERKPIQRRVIGELALDGRYARTWIPVSSAVERMSETQVPTVLASPQSLAARRYVELLDELQHRFELTP